MKVTFTAKVTPASVKTMLSDQEEKKQMIINFCKDKNISHLEYKDSELEFTYNLAATNKQQDEQLIMPKRKVETRGGDKNGKT